MRSSTKDTVDGLTSGVFARARAAGIGYDQASGITDMYAAANGYTCMDADSPLMNPPEESALEQAFAKTKARGAQSFAVSPPGALPQRARLAPSPRVATLVATFMLVLAGLVVAWQVFSAPPREPVAGTVEASGDRGEALRDADSRGANGDLARGAKDAGSESGKNAEGKPVGGRQTTASPELFLPGSNGSELVVYVSGQVEHPGVVHLVDPSRVADALNAAGGAKPGADLQVLNLARPVVDGEQINVPLPGETPPPGVSDSAPVGAGGASSSGAGGASGPGSSGAGGASGAGSSAGSSADGKVNLNTADVTALQTLSGIGPALAQRIVDYRDKNGNFHSVDQLDEVRGIGPALMERLRDHVTV